MSITLDHHQHFILHQRLIVWPLIIEDTSTPEEGNELRTWSSTASPHSVAVPRYHIDINDLNQGGHDSLSELSSLWGENLSEGEGYEMRKSGAI